MSGKENRNVFLISRFSLCNPNGKEIFTTAVKNKFKLSVSISGENGFGYDSILIPSQYSIYLALTEGRLESNRALEILNKSLCIADLTQEEKNAINHRGRIAKEIAEFLKDTEV